MTITARLLTFFLATLGAVLAGFSTALVLLARDYLYRQTDARLEAAANTLVAACEVGPEGVEWEPRERALAFGVGPAGDAVAWLVTDDRGRPVDRSGDPAADDLLTEAAARLTARTHPTGRIEWRGERWRVRQQWLVAPPAAGPTVPRPAAGETRYPAVAVTVGVPLGPVSAALWRVAAVLSGLSAAVWLLALVAGRAVCRRALRPLTRMADAARSMPADDLGGRLPVGRSADELADLGRAFNDLLDRLGEAYERQRRFAGEASHQLRTPLTAVLGQVEVALRRDRPPEEYRRVLESVRGQADRLRRLVESLLFLARADGEAGLPDRERIDLAAWVPDHLRTWADHPRTGDLRPEAEAEGPVWIAADRVILGELLNNLIDNALKYSPAGTPIVVRFGAGPSSAWVEVVDQGWGVGRDDQAHLFRPFYRSAEARRRGVSGVGLGLAVAARLAKLVGGSIEVESEPAKGSRFRVNVPATESVTGE